MSHSLELSNLLMAGAVLTLLLQTLTLVGLIWKGGRWSQRIEDGQAEQDKLIIRIAEQLDKIETRVGHLEGRRA